MFDIWNHKTNERLPLSDYFKSYADAWAYVRSFLNVEDYEVRPLVIKTVRNPKGAGRKPLNLPKRKRRNLNIERTELFDGNLQFVRELIATKTGKPVSEVSQTEAVRTAVFYYALTNGWQNK